MTTADAAPAAPAALRPVVAVDVDGVLNPDDPRDAETLGYQPHHYNGPGPDGQLAEGTVWLHPDHGNWLTELATAGAELVWCTSWRHLAATWIGPRLGMPTDLTVIDITAAGVRWGHQSKLFDLYRAVGDRPVAVLDDAFGGKDPDHAHHRTRTGAPTLLVPVNPRTGLRRADIDTVHAWLHRLPRPGSWWHQAPPDIRPAPLATRPSPNRGGRPRRARSLQEAIMTSVPEPDDTPPPLSVGDPVLGKTRLLARQCRTCIFHPGNRMHLAPGRLKQIVDETLADGSYVICHDTLPYGEHPEAQPAICRGFADRYTTWRLQVIARLYGFVEVPPPGEPATPTADPDGE